MDSGSDPFGLMPSTYTKKSAESESLEGKSDHEIMKILAANENLTAMQAKAQSEQIVLV